MLCRIYTLQVTKWEPCKHINTFTVPLLSSESGPAAFWNGDLKLVVSRGVPNVYFQQEWESHVLQPKKICNNYLNMQVYFFFLLFLQNFFFVLCNNIRNVYVKIKMVLWFICFFFFLWLKCMYQLYVSRLFQMQPQTGYSRILVACTKLLAPSWGSIVV